MFLWLCWSQCSRQVGHLHVALHHFTWTYSSCFPIKWALHRSEHPDTSSLHLFHPELIFPNTGNWDCLTLSKINLTSMLASINISLPLTETANKSQDHICLFYCFIWSFTYSYCWSNHNSKGFPFFALPCWCNHSLFTNSDEEPRNVSPSLHYCL